LPPETYVLGFDTSAAHCAAALLCGDRLVEAVWEPMEKGQAEALMPLLEGVLARAGIGWRDLAALGVGTGPGNFTGVRISVAAARGLALGLGVPAVGVTGFEAVGFGLPEGTLVTLDARRGALWLAGEGVAAGQVTLEALPAGLAGRAVAGHRADEVAAALGGPVLAQPVGLAEAITRIAAQRSATPQPRPAPLYLRGADAALPSEPPVVILP
jgi:tRNA threonylcarbamoyl adenosine modification protein YeaZ